MKPVPYIFLLIGLVLQASCVTTISYFQPAIDNGGRTEAIAIDPKNEKIIYVASSSGGLFRSFDAGASWNPVDTLPSYAVTDVEFSPDNPKILVATAAVGFASSNNGGIWLSTDGGLAWSKPKNPNAPASNRCSERNGAYSVSFEAGTQNVYVATDCGIAISRDRGLSWSHEALGKTVSVKTDLSQNRQYSVQAGGSNRVWSAGNDGIWYSDDNGKKWNQSSPTQLKGRGGAPHAFAASPSNSKYAFMVDHKHRLHQTSDGGQTWTQEGVTGVNMRPPFVRTALSVSGKTNEFDVYFGDGVKLVKKTFKQDNDVVKAVSPSWTKLALNHSDPCDIAFHHNNKDPYIAASDGGLHTTKDMGKTWSYMSGGSTGYGALQITEITGQFITSGNKHTDLYFGTQDNDLWASKNGGNTWPNKLQYEGFYIRVPRYDIDHKNTRISGMSCAGCNNFITEEHFENRKNWTNPPDGDSKGNDWDGFPFLVRKGHYYQVAINQDDAPNVRKLMFSDDYDQNWKEKATTTADLYNRPQISSPSKNNTKIYHCVRRNTFTPKGEKVYGLVQVEDIYKKNASINNADGNGFGSLGIFTTMFAWYPMFDVNPENSDHLIAADVQKQRMIVSGDGGKNWQVNQGLSDLLTSNGKYLFGRGRFSLVSNISFDPDRPCRVLIGTRQNGAFYSMDGGANWKSVAGTKNIYNISSFFFAGKVIYMSTYGMGLYKLHLKEGPTSCLQVKLPKKPPAGPSIPEGAIVVNLKDGKKSDFPGPETAYCDECTYALATESHLTDIHIEGDDIKRVSIAGGSFINYAPGAGPVSLPFRVSLQKSAGKFEGVSAVADIAEGSMPIRGLILRGANIEGVIVGARPIQLNIIRSATIATQAKSVDGGNDFVPVNTPVIIFGNEFSPSREAGPVGVMVNGESRAETRSNEEGKVVATLEMDLQVGSHELILWQETPTRFISAETDLRIVVSDEE